MCRRDLLILASILLTKRIETKSNLPLKRVLPSGSHFGRGRLR
jgi:hypothetical protein